MLMCCWNISDGIQSKQYTYYYLLALGKVILDHVVFVLHLNVFQSASTLKLNVIMPLCTAEVYHLLVFFHRG